MINAVPLGRYQHYKGNIYDVVAIARHSETGEEMVVYQSVKDITEYWVRPLPMFTETVDHEGETVPRFSKLP